MSVLRSYVIIRWLFTCIGFYIKHHGISAYLIIIRQYFGAGNLKANIVVNRETAIKNKVII